MHVTLAADAGQALAEIRRAEPDAVIMDLMLPGMDGYEATRAIRQMPERGHVPVVAATAAVLPGDRARALEAGCDDIVAKPYDVEELVARVAAAIEARAARNQPVAEEARAGDARLRAAGRGPAASGAVKTLRTRPVNTMIHRVPVVVHLLVRVHVMVLVL